jgi:hypothetical protein
MPFHSTMNSPLPAAWQNYPLPQPEAEPAIDDQPEAPRGEFPTDALPEPLQSIVWDAARQTSTPIALCAAVAIGTASASIGAGYRVLSAAGRETPANLFVFALAESGTGKGQAYSVITAPMHEAVNGKLEEWKLNHRPQLMADMEAANADLDRGRKELRGDLAAADAAATREAIKEAIKRQDEAIAALARSPMVNIGNATAEAIVEALANAPGEAGAIISAEARDIIDNLLGRYSKPGSSDEAIFLQAYSGDRVVHTRKKQPALTLAFPCLSLCLAAQPDIWQRMSSDPRLMESGFLARCLIFDAKAKASRPSNHRIPERVRNQWAATIQELINIRQEGEPAIVTPSREASEILYRLANHAADMRDEDGGWTWCRPFAARLAENAWRLALVFHAVGHPGDATQHPLTAATASNAVTVANWFFSETLALLAPARSKKNTERLDRLIGLFRERGMASMSVRDLSRRHGFEEVELAALAGEFSSRMNIIKSKPGPQGGQPSLLVCIPPQITQ